MEITPWPLDARTSVCVCTCDNGSNHLAALCEYRRLKDLQKGLISRIGLRKMIIKFEETGNLSMLPGRGRKSVGTETGEEVAIAVVERATTVPSFLQQGVDQCHASWRFRGRQYEKFCNTF
ncbi:hypothetical protein TNCV_3468721 [Trichonephila clavipes]|nr:hypothetical protein TNCV_3468721 [Trichonephila clavipes]